MSKDTLIERIQEHNPTAGEAFLMRFDEAALNRYLDHLQHLAQPRNSAWVRVFETRAIVAHTRDEMA
jgi:hypothetical protein